MAENEKYTPRSARETAVLSLCRQQKDGKYSNLEADAAIKKFKLQGAEKALYTKLFYGCTERLYTLDYIINALSERSTADMTPQMLNILRAAVYQIIYLDRVPDYAAVSESVELAKKYERQSAGTFVNAVLRRLCRDGAPVIKNTHDEQFLSVAYSVSRDVCAVFVRQYGFEEAERIFKAMLLPQYITLRVNTLKISRAELLEKLTAAGIDAENTPQSPFGIKLKAHVDIPALNAVIDGLAYIEDEASQLAVLALDPKPGDTLIDVCAAPGGKTVSCAIQMENKGEIFAFDIHENKLKLIEKTAGFCGVGIIKCSARDGRQRDPSLVGKADRVLCDVPCSGLGVIAKKPDIRYKEIGDLSPLIATQRAILAQSCEYLKPGGILVYSTCTLNREENGENVKAFLAGNDGFELICEQTLLPHMTGTDGFYTAKIIKKEATK